MDTTATLLNAWNAFGPVAMVAAVMVFSRWVHRRTAAEAANQETTT